MRQTTSVTGCVRWSVGRSVGQSVGWLVTHSLDDPHVAPYWPIWPWFSLPFILVVVFSLILCFFLACSFFRSFFPSFFFLSFSFTFFILFLRLIDSCFIPISRRRDRNFSRDTKKRRQTMNPKFKPRPQKENICFFFQLTYKKKYKGGQITKVCIKFLRWTPILSRLGFLGYSSFSVSTKRIYIQEAHCDLTFFYCERIESDWIFSRVLRDCTPRCFGPSVVWPFGRSVGPLFGQRPRRGRWPMLSHIWGIFSSSSSSSSFSFSFFVPPLKSQSRGPNPSLEAQIPALRPKS